MWGWVAAEMCGEAWSGVDEDDDVDGGNGDDDDADREDGDDINGNARHTHPRYDHDNFFDDSSIVI